MKQKLARVALVGVLAIPLAATACDQEDVNDVQEVGNEVEQEVDQLDKDGKDD